MKNELAKNDIIFTPQLKKIENKMFYFPNGDEYFINKAIQTIKFELDKTSRKIKSEAGMMVEKVKRIYIR